MKNAPCKNCGDRFVGCHSICPLYKEFQEFNNKRREAIAKEKMEEDIQWRRKR